MSDAAPGRPPTATAPPSAEEIARLRRQLLKKGAEVNDKLVRLLAHQEVRLDELLGQGRPGETPLERLRRFMKIIDASLIAIREGRYGRCQRCGDGLPFAHLEQIPWIDTCARCAATTDG